MTLYNFFVSQIGSIDNPVIFTTLSFMIMFLVLDFIHTFYNSVFSMFKH